jgi:hypothetical protein
MLGFNLELSTDSKLQSGVFVLDLAVFAICFP